MSAKPDTLDDLIAGGLIGATLGALLANDKEEGAMLGAILGAAFSSTFEANQAALQTKEPVLIVQEGKLFKVYPNGEKLYLKDLPKSNRKWPKRLILK